MRMTLVCGAIVLCIAGSARAQTAPAGQGGQPAGMPPAEPGVVGDTREDFEATAYVGIAIDTFAAQEIRNYLNPEANGVQRERSLFGFDFAYRLWSEDESDQGSQVWVYGETVHGVRSEDIDCKTAPNLPSCKSTIAGFGAAIPESALFMLRNASSLEAFVGGRYEFHGLNLAGRNPARVYVKGQLGFLTLAGSDGDAKDIHHVALGATAVGGPRSGSYLEVGFGRTDLFLVNRNRRFKINGYLQQAVGGGVSLFAELLADVDGGSGADAIQSYFGLSFDVGQIVGTVQRGDDTRETSRRRIAR